MGSRNDDGWCVIAIREMNFLLLVAVLCGSVLLSLHLFLGESQIYSVLEIVSPSRSINIINTYCRQHFAPVLFPQHDQLVCGDSAKKQKYIWIPLDAWAAFQTGELLHAFNESSYYHVLNTGYPQSAAIHATQLVGRPSRNYVGGFINDETVIEQIRHGSENSTIITTPFPLGKLLGSERFTKEYIWDRREPYPFRALELAGDCMGGTFVDVKTIGTSQDRDLTFEDAQRYMKERAEDFLNHDILVKHVQRCLRRNGVKRGGNNLVYYTFIMDSFNHNYGALNEKTMEHAAAVYAGIVSIIKALKASGLDDEYVLFVSSDHGGQFFMDEDELCNHGCRMDGGNEAIFYIYSKGEGERFTDLWIKTEDVGPTMSQYVKWAGVSGTATGNVMPMFTSGDSYLEKYRYMALRSKEIQLLSHLNYLDPANPREISHIMGKDVSQLGFDEVAISQFIVDYPVHLAELQKQVEALQKPKQAYLVLAVAGCVCGYFLVWPLLAGMGLGLRDWVCVGLLFTEQLVVLVFNQGLGRVEKMIWWPLIFIQLGFIVIGVLYGADTQNSGEKRKHLSPLLRLVNLPKVLWKASTSLSRQPLSQLTSTDQCILVITCNTLLLVTGELGEVFTYIGDSFYFLHYLLAILFIFLDTRRQEKDGHPQLWTRTRYASLFFLALTMVYRFITDPSTGDQTEEMMAVIRVFYVLIMIWFLLILTVVPESERGRQIAYPVFIVFFLIASEQQRSHFLLLFIPVMETISRLAREQDSLYLYCLLISQATCTYLTNRGSYGFDISLRAGNHSWGTYPDEFPIFTGVIFGFHKMSWYHMSGVYLFKSMQHPMSSMGWNFMKLVICRGLAVLFVFFIGFYANPANTLSVFMWTMANCSVMLFSHPILLFDSPRKE